MFVTGIASGGDLGLSLTGLRIGPRDPTTHAAKVGVRNEVVKPDHSMGSLQPRILKVFKAINIIFFLFSIKTINHFIGKSCFFWWIQDTRRVEKE